MLKRSLGFGYLESLDTRNEKLNKNFVTTLICENVANWKIQTEFVWAA